MLVIVDRMFRLAPISATGPRTSWMVRRPLAFQVWRMLFQYHRSRLGPACTATSCTCLLYTSPLPARSFPRQAPPRGRGYFSGGGIGSPPSGLSLIHISSAAQRGHQTTVCRKSLHSCPEYNTATIKPVSYTHLLLAP